VTDDIVTRLRGLACPECGLPSTHNQFDEAADEIERLRAELEIYKDLYAREAVERTMVEQVKESAHWVADMMNKGNINPKDVYPKGRYSGD
jgi:hypothetical protein